jgi:membrane protein required for colicin V production
MNVSFNFVDVLIVLTILASAGYAAWRGFLSETLSIFAWAAAAFATLYFGPWLVPLARGMISTYWLASLVAYAGVFLAVFIPLSFMSYRFSESVKNSPIGPLDRALGVAFGVVRGLVVAGLAYLAFTYFVPIRRQPDWVTEARTLPMIQSTGDVMLTLMPDRTRDNFADQPGARPDDAIGNLIRDNEDANRVPEGQREPGNTREKPAENLRARKTEKGYGAAERRALDKLFESAGNGKK